MVGLDLLFEPFAPEAALYFAGYSTPEYFIKSEQYGRKFGRD